MMSIRNNTRPQNSYHYELIGEDFHRNLQNHESVLMVRTSNGERRDAVARMLLALPNFTTLFDIKDQVYIKGAAERQARRSLIEQYKSAPRGVRKPQLFLIVNSQYKAPKKLNEIALS